MTLLKGKIDAYDFLSKRQGIPFSEFTMMLTKAFGETTEYWEIVKDELIAENRIVLIADCHTNSLNSSIILLYTDSYLKKCGNKLTQGV
jgi:hypothetical protein